MELELVSMKIEPENEATCVKTEPQELCVDTDHEIEPENEAACVKTEPQELCVDTDHEIEPENEAACVKTEPQELFVETDHEIEPENEAACVKTEPQELCVDADHEIITEKQELCEDSCSTSAGTSQASAWVDYESCEVKSEVCVTEPGVYMKERLCTDSTSQADPDANEIKRKAEAVCIIKDEPDDDISNEQAYTGSNLYANEFKDADFVCVTEVHVKEEPFEDASLCVSDAAVSNNLYVKDEVEELVLSPASIHHRRATSSLTETPMKPEQKGRQKNSSTRLKRPVGTAKDTPQPGNTDTPSNGCQSGEGVAYNALKKRKHCHSISERTRGPSAKKNVMPDLCHSTSKPKPLKVEPTCLNYMCPDCDYTTVDKTTLKTHMKSHTEKKQYYCDHCSYSSHDKINLKRHLVRHDRKRRFKCSHCDLSFYRIPDARKHEKTHSTEKPHKCSSCDYQCIRKRELHIHMRTHTGVKPFQCNKCDYKSTRKFSLQRHQLVHGGETFKCNLCSFKTLHKTNLRVHERIHTGEMPYECSRCDFKCRYRCSLRNHLEKSFNCSQQQV